MSKSDDAKVRRELLAEAKRSGVKLPRGASNDAIERRLQDRYNAKHRAVLGGSWDDVTGGAR